MNTKLPKVLLTYKRKEDLLETISGNVSSNLYPLPLYPNPPVTKPALDAKRTEWLDAKLARKQGGTLATELKNDLPAELEEMLYLLALYVQLNCGGLVANVLAAGFEVMSERGASFPLPPPEALIAKNTMVGKIVLKTAAIKGARCYKAEYALVSADGTAGEWQNGGLHAKSRGIAVDGLVSGALYALRIRAVGGSTGESEWSHVVRGRCM